MKAYKVETEQGTFTIEEIAKNDLYADLEYADKYKKFYEVKSENGNLAFFLAKGDPDAPKEIVGWYKSFGTMHHGFGKTFKEIIDILIRDAWKYA